MSGTWLTLKNKPSFNVDTMLLLTDGRVMVQEANTSRIWHALTPDSSGSYINGTWSTLASMNHAKEYFASGILKDGQVIVCGGEYDENGQKETNDCEIYDPVKDTWSSIPSPYDASSGDRWNCVGDAPSVVLPDGKFMIGDIFSAKSAIYDPGSKSWKIVPKGSSATEETWILLPDNSVLTVQCSGAFQSERCITAPGSYKWQNEGPVPVVLVDKPSQEIGPAILLPDKRTIFFGAGSDWSSDGKRMSGKTAIYTMPSVPTGKGSWTPGPDIPAVSGKEMVSKDCPAVLLPNGKVLFTVAEFKANKDDWGSPTYLLEYDYTNSKTPMAVLANQPVNSAPTYKTRLLLLPTGEVLFADGTDRIQVYQPGGTPQAAWRPAISSVVPSGAGEYYLSGSLLSGVSQACIYGDDLNPATNYPIVKLTNNSTGKVYYARTYNFNSMGVGANGATSCNFMPGFAPAGSYTVSVIANGITSSNTKSLNIVSGLMMAWKGAGSDQSIWFSTFDGTSWAGQKQVQGAGTSMVPSLAVFNNKLYMAWKGAGSDQGIWYASFDGGTWSGPGQVSNVGSSVGPALAVYNGRLYMAWKGAGSDQGLYYNSFDGSKWSGQQAVPHVGGSYELSLTVYNSRLYMAWKGAGSDTAIWFTYFDGSNWAAQQKVPSATTSVGPSLAVYNGRLYMAWKGQDNEQKVMYSSYNGSSWDSPQQVGWFLGWGWTSFRPVLAVYGNKLYAIWKGSDSDQAIWYSAFNGSGWTNQQSIPGVATSLGCGVAAI